MGSVACFHSSFIAGLHVDVVGNPQFDLALQTCGCTWTHVSDYSRRPFPFAFQDCTWSLTWEQVDGKSPRPSLYAVILDMILIFPWSMITGARAFSRSVRGQSLLNKWQIYLRGQKGSKVVWRRHEACWTMSLFIWSMVCYIYRFQDIANRGRDH